MASVYKRGKNWIASHLGTDGLWKAKSAGTDKGMALQIANKLQTDSMLRREGIIDAAMDRFAAAERKPLAEHLAEFEADILARNGKEAYAFQVQQRAERIVMLGEVERLSQLKPAALNAAIAKLRDKAHKKASLAHHIRAAKRFRACYELSGAKATKMPETRWFWLTTSRQAMGGWLCERTKPALDAEKPSFQSL